MSESWAGSSIDGFIIANRAWDDRTKIEMGKRTFSRTAGAAWKLHIGYEKAATIDASTLIQR